MKSRLIATFLINIFITLSEIIGGLLSGSLSLLSDAIHNLTDAVSAIIGYIALKLGEKENSEKYTFGLKRAEILASFTNALLLIIVSFGMVTEAVKRLINPNGIIPDIMFISAIVALAGNILSAIFLHKHSKQNLNVKSVYLHMFADSLASFSLVIGSIIIKLYHLNIIDPVLTVLISGYIIHESTDIIKKSSHILLEGSPENIDLDKLKKSIEEIPEVKNIHHLHIWSLKDDVMLAEMHAEVNDTNVSNTERILEKIKKITSKFGINHVTIQFEVNYCKNKDLIPKMKGT